MKLTGEFCESLYSTLVKIRRFDEKVAELFQQGIVKGTAHSYVGQEAVAAGACANLREDDFIDGHHMLRKSAAKYSRRLAKERLEPWLARVGALSQ